MIIVKLWGGLCNQMFQYAFGYAMAKKRNDKLAFDISFYSQQPQYVSMREMEIEKYFRLPEFTIVDRPKEVNFFENRIVNNIVRRLNFFHCSLPNNIVFIKEKTHVYTEKVPYFEGKINYYDGYWQSSGYFSEYKDEIREIFRPKQEYEEVIEDYSEKYHKSDSVAVHIRRGDLTGKMRGFSEERLLKYYHDSMRYFASKIAAPQFFVFSDDIEWCKKNIPTDYGTVDFGENVEHKAIYDLFGIASCENGIMSLSTFSWWGNWLRKRTDSVVLTPKGVYFNNRFVEEHWVKM